MKESSIYISWVCIYRFLLRLQCIHFTLCTMLMMTLPILANVYAPCTYKGLREPKYRFVSCEFSPGIKGKEDYLNSGRRKRRREQEERRNTCDFPTNTPKIHHIHIPSFFSLSPSLYIRKDTCSRKVFSLFLSSTPFFALVNTSIYFTSVKRHVLYHLSTFV